MTEPTVILAGTHEDAAVIAERLGLARDQWVQPSHIGQVKGRTAGPVYFDYMTFERNPARETLREWFAWRITPPELRPPYATKEDTMPTTQPAAPKRPWFVGVARNVGLDYLNQTNGNVVAIDATGDRWTPDPTTGVWGCDDLDDKIADTFGPFDVYAA